VSDQDAVSDEILAVSDEARASVSGEAPCSVVSLASV